MAVEVLDIALRGMATGLFLICILVISADRIAMSAKLASFLTAITSLARIWSILPPGFEMNDGLMTVLGLIGAWAPFALNWLLLSIFLDDKRALGVWMMSGAVISVGTTLTFWTSELVPFLRVYAALHFLALSGMILASYRGDLLDARRRMRLILAITLSVFAIGRAVISTQVVGPTSEGMALAQTAAYCACVFLFVWWSLRADLDNWPGEVLAAKNPEPDPVQMHGIQKVLIARIDTAMTQGIWRREGLTVADLAQEVGVPEHRVRKAINQVLGYRNFASFINRKRIEAAKARLCRPDDAEVTVLEIAYDVGFRSLGPFNRYFREETGQSPTEFRALNITTSPVNFEKDPPIIEK